MLGLVCSALEKTELFSSVPFRMMPLPLQLSQLSSAVLARAAGHREKGHWGSPNAPLLLEGASCSEASDGLHRM